MDAVTLDQFAVFIAITEEGSFASAARRLGRAQSAITYAVQKLEDQTGVTLFDRSSYRASLTEEGKALLPRIRRIMDDVGDFRLLAKNFTQGIEAEVSILLDSFLPLTMFAPALRVYRDRYPIVPLRVNSVKPDGLLELFKTGSADLLISAAPFPPDLAFENWELCDVELVAVAAPHHPLAKQPKRITTETLRDHLQIIVSVPDVGGSHTSYGVVGVNQWHVSDANLRHELIRSGLGWGSMPYPTVAAEIERGDLIMLDPQQWDSADRMPRFKCMVSQRKDTSLGPAARCLLECLRGHRPEQSVRSSV